MAGAHDFHALEITRVDRDTVRRKGAIARVLQAAVEGAGLPPTAVQLVEGGREVVRGLLRQRWRAGIGLKPALPRYFFTCRAY